MNPEGRSFLPFYEDHTLYVKLQREEQPAGTGLLFACTSDKFRISQEHFLQYPETVDYSMKTHTPALSQIPERFKSLMMQA